MNALEELVAKKQIEELVLTYCRAVDRRDYQTLAKLYHEDSIDDHGGMFCGTGAEYVAWLPGVLEAMQVTMHSISNHLVKVQSRDDGKHYAEGEAYCHAYHLTPDGQELIIGGRYLDKYIFDQERWQFKHRKLVMDWNNIRPSQCDMTSPIVAGTPVGTRQQDDASEKFFDILLKA